MVFNVKFKPVLSEFNNAKHSIEDALKSWDTPFMDMMDIMLAIDESVTNIISHGYETSTLEDYIELKLASEKNKITIEISDNGKKFDFHSAPAPDIRKNLAGTKKGGFGVHLIKSVMDHVTHNRENNKNILTLTKNLHLNNGHRNA